MSKQQAMHFKECNPVDTVNRILEILSKEKIDVEENWKTKDETINTYSLRLNIKGTEIGTNGKGVTKELARASAYAEFMERYQNGILILNKKPQKDEYDFYVDIDEKIMTAKELVEDNSKFMQMYFKKRGMDKSSKKQKERLFKEVQKTELILLDKEDFYITLPFKNITKDVIEYWPINTYSLYYGSNGMCAGNTYEEAVVQGLSEIIERVVQLKVMNEKIALPDIPESYIKKFPYIYEMYKKLQKKSGYKAILKDASLGGKYPVAALILIEENTGKYGIKFGCHPDYGIAMERAFTEATQGRKIEEYAILGTLDFNNSYIGSEDNTLNALQVGVATFPFQFFDNISDYVFTPTTDVSELSNKEILDMWVEDLKKDGHEVFVRDVSLLGFPSYYVVIPNLSEVNNMTDEKYRLVNTRMYLNQKLEDLENFNEEDGEYLLNVIKSYESILGETDLNKYFIDRDTTNFPGEDVKAGGHYLAAMCATINKEYQKAVYFMKHVVCFADYNNKISKERKAFYHAIYYYLQGMSVLNNSNRVFKYLDKFFEEDICEKVKECFAENKNILIKQYKIQSNEKDVTSYWRELYLKNIRRAKHKANIKQL